VQYGLDMEVRLWSVGSM